MHDTGRTCLVAVLGDAGPTLVRWFAGSPAVVTSLAVGSVLPLLHSATGRVYLTFGDRPVMDERLSRLPVEARPSASEVATLRDEVARECCALIDGQLIPGLRALAVPVFDLQGRIALVVTSLASEAVARAGDGAARVALLEACRDMTQALGGEWPQGGQPCAGKALRAVR